MRLGLTFATLRILDQRYQVESLMHEAVVRDRFAVSIRRPIIYSRQYFFCSQLCGAMAQKGYDLAKIRSIAAEANKYMATLGVCLSACSLPGQSNYAEITWFTKYEKSEEPGK